MCPMEWPDSMSFRGCSYLILYQVERTEPLVAVLSLLVCIQYHDTSNFPICRGPALALVLFINLLSCFPPIWIYKITSKQVRALSEEKNSIVSEPSGQILVCLFHKWLHTTELGLYFLAFSPWPMECSWTDWKLLCSALQRACHL